MEIDDHYGVTLAVLTAGIARAAMLKLNPAGRFGKGTQVFKIHPAPSLHHRIMIAWASLRIEGLMDKKEREAVLETMLLKQLANGGWSMPSFLVDWKSYERKDGKPHDVNSSDAYGTGLALVVAREMGVPATGCRLQGVAWLKSNQRRAASGSVARRLRIANTILRTPVARSLCLAPSLWNSSGWPFDATKR